MRLLQLTLAAGLTVSLSAQSVTKPTAPIPPTSPQTLQAIDAMMAQATAQGVYRGNVLVAQNGTVLLQKSYGMANFEWQQANTANAKFRVGSLTKTLTAMLILDLAQDKLLKLDDTVSDHLPYYRKDTGSIMTIAQLLDHSSGLPSFTDLPDFWHLISRIKLPTTTFVKRYCEPDLLSKPGTHFFYSNTGYFLLGAIAESVTGKTYRQAMQERVLGPLGMADTDYGQNADILSEFAYPYMMQGCTNTVAPFTEMSVPFSAGGLYSTTGDLNKFNDGLNTNKVLNPYYTTQMLKGHINEGGPARSAYGWDVTPVVTPSGPVVVHAKIGQIWGYANFMIRTPDFFVVLLGNMTEANSSNLALAITMMLYGATPQQATPPIPPQIAISQQICKDGVAAALAAVKQNPPPVSAILSDVGNGFLGTEMQTDVSQNDIAIATAVFQLNASLFPTDPTVYRDLATLYGQLAASNGMTAESMPPLSPSH